MKKSFSKCRIKAKAFQPIASHRSSPKVAAWGFVECANAFAGLRAEWTLPRTIPERASPSAFQSATSPLDPLRPSRLKAFPGRIPSLPRPLAWPLSWSREKVRARLARVAVLLRFSPTPMAQTAHHQRDRALLCGSATPHSPHGVLRQRRKRGPHHLLHLPEIQPGMENPHPQPIYTSSLTAPLMAFFQGVFTCQRRAHSGTLRLSHL